MELDLTSLLPECILDCVLLILLLLLLSMVESVSAGVCGCKGAVAKFHVHAPDFRPKLLVPQCHGIHLLAHTDLLFIEESHALCLCECVRPWCTGISSVLCLDVGWQP